MNWRNGSLLHKARKIRARAAVDFPATGKTTAAFGSFYHMTRSGSWNRPRHAIAKVLHLAGKEQRCRFLVTSLDWESPLVNDEMRKARDEQENQESKPPRDLLARVIASVRRIQDLHARRLPGPNDLFLRLALPCPAVT